MITKMLGKNTFLTVFWLKMPNQVMEEMYSLKNLKYLQFQSMLDGEGEIWGLLSPGSAWFDKLCSSLVPAALGLLRSCSGGESGFGFSCLIFLLVADSLQSSRSCLPQYRCNRLPVALSDLQPRHLFSPHL